jgi:hypothetical protein
LCELFWCVGGGEQLGDRTNSNGGGRLCNHLSIMKLRTKNPTIWETTMHMAISSFIIQRPTYYDFKYMLIIPQIVDSTLTNNIIDSN